ncbi:hypothetical protein PHISP_02337 [Aspergillus sp. HF37]|nr:hypothetical protein PHISP_02337 [Aspergillus sp. HF37]
MKIIAYRSSGSFPDGAGVEGNELGGEALLTGGACPAAPVLLLLQEAHTVQGSWISAGRGGPWNPPPVTGVLAGTALGKWDVGQAAGPGGAEPETWDAELETWDAGPETLDAELATWDAELETWDAGPETSAAGMETSDAAGEGHSADQGTQGDQEAFLGRQDRSELAVAQGAYDHHRATLGGHWVPSGVDHGGLVRFLEADGV